MLLGYNTNGLANHDPLAAIELLATIGYRSIAITIDHHCLNPFAEGWQRQLDAVRRLLEEHRLGSVIETGARFLLDPEVKHEPTLVSPTADARQRRVQFLHHAVDVAAALGSDCVSLFSGIVRDGATHDAVFRRLLAGLEQVLAYAHGKRVTIGFEPEPGMFIDTMARFDELTARIAQGSLHLTLDVGHLHCQGEVPIAEQIRRYAPRLVNVHVEDMRKGVHEHLMFGEGEIDFAPLIDALRRAGYRGGVHVELSRHSHEGPQAARRAFAFLQPLVSGS